MNTDMHCGWKIFPSYNAQRAVDWAAAYNQGDGAFRGRLIDPPMRRRFCTNYVCGALAAGGLATSRGWSGNQQLIRFMLAHRDQWVFRSQITDLLPGDFVLFTDQPDALHGTAEDGWADIDAVTGTSLWNHVALVIGYQRLAEWNPERWNVFYENLWPGQPVRRFVHLLRR